MPRPCTVYKPDGSVEVIPGTRPKKIGSLSPSEILAIEMPESQMPPVFEEQWKRCADSGKPVSSPNPNKNKRTKSKKKQEPTSNESH